MIFDIFFHIFRICKISRLLDELVDYNSEAIFFNRKEEDKVMYRWDMHFGKNYNVVDQ